MLHWLCRMTHQIFSQNSSEFVTPWLVSGKPKQGLSNGALRPLSAICAQSSTIVHFCGPFEPLSKGNFCGEMTTIVGNRGQLCTSTWSPHLLSPHLSGGKKAHKHKLFALVNVQMALGQTAGCPRVNRAKRFMCSPRNTGNINFSLWLTGGLSQGCPDFQKVYVFKVYVPFSWPNLDFPNGGWSVKVSSPRVSGARRGQLFGFNAILWVYVPLPLGSRRPPRILSRLLWGPKWLHTHTFLSFGNSFPDYTGHQAELKVTELRWQRAPKTQIFAENRRFLQIHPFSWKVQHLEGAGNRRKPQIFAENRRFSQKTAGNRRLGSVTLGPSPLARP